MASKMLPEWIPTEAWEAYILMRKGMGKKYVATDYAQTLLIKKLDAWRKEGQDIEEIINRSIEFSYTGLFPLKDKKAANWWESDAGIIAKGKESGMEARNGETMKLFKDRLNKVIAAGGMERRAEARTYQHDLLDQPDRESRAEPALNRDLARSGVQAALSAFKPRLRH